MQIKAQSIFDYETIKALTHATLYKKKKPKTTFIALIVFSGVIALWSIIMMLLWGMDKQLIRMLFVSILMALLDWYLYAGLAKVQYRALHHMQNVENEFTFYDEVMMVSSQKDQYHGTAELKYTMIPKVIETSKHLIIFQNKNQAFIVDKSTITSGSMEDIRMKLVPLLKKKYLYYKY